MTLRKLVLSGGLALSMLVAGCATSVAGQAQIDPAAISSSVESPHSTATQPGAAESTEQQSPTPTTAAPSPTGALSPSELQSIGALPTTGGKARSSTSTPTQNLAGPGSLARCEKVIAGVSAFSSLLSSVSAGSADTKVSQADVDATLKQMPASGLPAKEQADMNVLRAAAGAAAGKTLIQLATSLSDDKTITALEDLSTWMSAGCS